MQIKETRCKELHKDLMQFYSTAEAPSRYSQLIPSMVQKTAATPPKLRGRAGEIRGIVPFIAQAARRYLGHSEVDIAAKRVAVELAKMYECLSQSQPHAAEYLAAASRRVAQLWVSLEAASPEPFWRVKPKLHLMQELCEEQLGSRPALLWCYRDEEFGGSCASMARRRGGRHSARSVAESVVLRFIAKESLPRAR